MRELQLILDNREKIKKLVLDDLERAGTRQTKIKEEIKKGEKSKEEILNDCRKKSRGCRIKAQLLEYCLGEENVPNYYYDESKCARMTKLSYNGESLLIEFEILTHRILQFSQDMSDLVREKDENPEVREWLSNPEVMLSLKPVFYGAVIEIPLKDLEKEEINSAIPFLKRIQELLEGRMDADDVDIEHKPYTSFDSRFHYFDHKHPEMVYELLSEIPGYDEFSEYFWLEYTESEFSGIEGDVFIAGSDLSATKRFLRIIPMKDDERKKLEDKLNKTTLSYDDIEELTGSLDVLNGFVPKDLVMFNVGQGNFSGLTDDSDEIKLVFDIGLSYTEKYADFSKRIKSAIDKIKNIDAEVFIISHYDLDHILAISYFENLSSGRIWIVPNPAELGELSKSAENLLKFLILTQQPYKVSNDTIKDYNLQLLTNNKSLTLYKGFKLNKNNNPVKNMNGRGLLLHVQGKNNTALLTGDSLYEYWGDTLIQHIDPDKLVYLVVPHHCCEYNLTIPDGAVNAKIDIIPVGDGNKYGHPHHSHKDALNGTIERTADYSITSGIKEYHLY